MIRTVNLEEILTLNYGRSLPERARVPGKYRVYGSGGSVGTHNESWVKGPGIIVGRKGTIGSVIWSDEDFFPIDTTYYVTVKDPSISLRYIFYLLKKLPLSSMNTDAAVPGLNRNNAYRLSVKILDKQTREAIVERLLHYDNLIENNRRRIALLEESARLLYREWFVHFRCRELENSYNTTQLPEGWSKTSIGEYCPFQYGKALKAESRVAGKHPVFGSSGVVGWHQEALVKGPGIVVGRKGNVGSVYFIQDDFWPIDTTYFITGPTVSEYLFLALEYTQFLNTDVAVPGLNRDFAHSREIILPSENFLEMFKKHVSPIFRQIKNLNEHSANLVDARDLLLPRLMDGRFAV